MRIDDNVLSIPPYISTNWNQVRALYVKGNLLVITLVDGDNVNIPRTDTRYNGKNFLGAFRFFRTRHSRFSQCQC